MREINPLSFSHICHAPIDCVFQDLFAQIILWIKPFFRASSKESLRYSNVGKFDIA